MTEKQKEDPKRDRLYGEEYWTILLCVDNYEDRILKGRFYHQTHPDGSTFYGIIDLLLKIETVLDSICLPQQFAEARRFAHCSPAPCKLYRPQWGTSMRGCLATFSLRVRFRQNASWQGTLVWLERKDELHFRSVLELIHMIDSALQSNLGIWIWGT